MVLDFVQKGYQNIYQLLAGFPRNRGKRFARQTSALIAS